MQCPNCKKENKENATFCEHCGAQLVSEKKRMSFFERRQAKERERLYIISKASLQEDDVKDIQDMDMGEVQAIPKGGKAEVRRKTALGLAASIVGVVVCVAIIYIIGRLKFNNTLRVALILAMFLLCFTAAAYAIDYGYRMRMVNAMCKSTFAVKKISYGKPPVMLLGDTFYDLKIKTTCDIPGCGAQMHIEEYNGEFIAVCNADRSHLRRLDAAALNVQGGKKDEKGQAEEEHGTSDDTQDGEKVAEDTQPNGEKAADDTQTKDGADRERK